MMLSMVMKKISTNRKKLEALSSKTKESRADFLLKSLSTKKPQDLMMMSLLIKLLRNHLEVIEGSCVF